MIEEILPRSARTASARVDAPGAALFAVEEALVSRADEKRRREFTTGRACAREALEQLDIEPGPILAACEASRSGQTASSHTATATVLLSWPAPTN
jgi:4'-phosphopantetheinyl transferase EntD